MLRKFSALIFALTMCLRITAAQQHQDAAAVAPQLKPREITPEMKRRIAAIQSALQPSTREWVEQQAKLESQKQSPDAPSIEAAVYNRFPALNTRGGPAKASDMNSLVAVVLMQEANDAEKDLQDTIAQVQAINNAKQKMRDLLSQLDQEIKSNPTPVNSTLCQTSLCKSLAASLNQISAATANLQKPLRMGVPAKPTYADLKVVQSQLQSSLDSMNEMSEMTSMRLQMAMDRRSKFVEALSNIMKKIDSTQETIVQNLKG
jgi:hypothetical protein